MNDNEEKLDARIIAEIASELSKMTDGEVNINNYYHPRGFDRIVDGAFFAVGIFGFVAFVSAFYQICDWIFS